MISIQGVAEGYVPVNKQTMSTIIGLSVYTYEGIGVIMPIMSSCNCPEKFPTLLMSAVGLLTVVYIVFPEICYAAFGDSMVESIIINMIPNSNWFIVTIKVLYMINLCCSYPLMMYPLHTITEGYWFKNRQAED